MGRTRLLVLKTRRPRAGNNPVGWVGPAEANQPTAPGEAMRQKMSKTFHATAAGTYASICTDFHCPIESS
jgi:hypothetical protein